MFSHRPSLMNNVCSTTIFPPKPPWDDHKSQLFPRLRVSNLVRKVASVLILASREWNPELKQKKKIQNCTFFISASTYTRIIQLAVLKYHISRQAIRPTHSISGPGNIET